MNIEIKLDIIFFMALKIYIYLLFSEMKYYIKYMIIDIYSEIYDIISNLYLCII